MWGEIGRRCEQGNTHEQRAGKGKQLLTHKSKQRSTNHP